MNLFGEGEATVYLELRSESGNADLFVKQCSSLDKKECRIRKKDIDNQDSSLLVSNNPTGSRGLEANWI